MLNFDMLIQRALRPIRFVTPLHLTLKVSFDFKGRSSCALTTVHIIQIPLIVWLDLGNGFQRICGSGSTAFLGLILLDKNIAFLILAALGILQFLLKVKEMLEASTKDLISIVWSTVGFKFINFTDFRRFCEVFDLQLTGSFFVLFGHFYKFIIIPKHF